MYCCFLQQKDQRHRQPLVPGQAKTWRRVTRGLLLRGKFKIKIRSITVQIPSIENGWLVLMLMLLSKLFFRQFFHEKQRKCFLTELPSLQSSGDPI